jgi:DNA-binding transcriptional LysR family regulator
VLDAIALNLRHLRAVCEVVACGSISKAAPRVHLSQPAITQAIVKLEQTLGASLFIRASDGMIATEAGAVLARRTARALDQIRIGAIAARHGVQGRRKQGFAGFDRLVTGPQLRALIAVSEARNFSLAARAAGLSQPSLHRAARDVERLAGVTFYMRTAQGIALTSAAAALARHARLAFAELEQLREELAALRNVDQARLSIGALPLARTSILPRAMIALAKERPGTLVRVVDGSYDDLLHELRHGGIDVLVGALRDPPPIDDVVQAPLFDDHLSVIGRRGHPLAGRRRISIRDLAAYPWIAPRPGPPGRARFDATFERVRITAREALIEASSLIVIRGLLMESDRLTLLSAHQVEPEIRHGMLEIIPFEIGQSPRPIGTTVRRDWQPTATQALFVEILRGICTRAPTTGRAYADFE